MMNNELIYKTKNINYKKGFIYVASLHYYFYEWALYSAQSLRDLYPEANITLFTHESFLDDRAYKLFNEIRIKIPQFKRAKMWCMSKTPYDITLYNDVDSAINSKKIRDIFDQLENYDLMFSSNQGFEHVVNNKNTDFIDLDKKIPVKQHGALCLYKKTDITLNFFETWYREYIKQITSDWPHSSWSDKNWKPFDMFTLWYILNDNKFNFSKKINVGELERKWNSTFIDGRLKTRPIVVQFAGSYETFKTVTGTKEVKNLSLKNDYRGFS